MSDPSVWSMFCKAADAAPHADCVVWGERRSTFSALRQRAVGVAMRLKAHGLGRWREHAALSAHESGQDLVAICMRNRTEYVEAVLGAFAARTVPVNVNYRYTPGELVEILAPAGVRAIIYESRFRNSIEVIRDRLPLITLFLEVSEDGVLMNGAEPFEEAAGGVDATRAHSFPDDTSPDDLCIVYTGGTTGAPKAVLWRQADLCWSLTGGVNSATGRPITSLTDLAGSVGQVDYRVLVLPPMMHLSGLSMVLIGLPAGAFLIMPDTLSFDTATALALAQRERASVILLVGNAMAKPLADALDQSTYDLSSVRSVVNGAAAMSPDVRDRLLRHLPEKAYVFDSLGASESGKQLQAVYRRSDAPGGAGKKFATLPTTAILDDSRSRLLSPHETAPGWLASTGRLPQGYLGDAGRTTKTFPVIDGVRYATPGDRARHDGIGGVELLGRDAVTINSGGEKIYAEEVESAILACPGVRDAIVVGRPSALWGMEVAAVVSRTNDALTAEAIIAACAQTLARYKLPKAVIFVDEIYRGPNGKADYAWARARALSGAAPDGATLDGAGPRTGSGG